MSSSSALGQLVNSHNQIKALEAARQAQCKGIGEQCKVAKAEILKYMQEAHVTCVLLARPDDSVPQLYLRLKKRETPRIINPDTVKEATFLITEKDIRDVSSSGKTVGEVLNTLFALILKKTTTKSSMMVCIEDSAERGKTPIPVESLPSTLQQHIRTFKKYREEKANIQASTRKKIEALEKVIEDVQPVVQKHLQSLPEGIQAQKVSIKTSDGAVATAWVREKYVKDHRAKKVSLKTFAPVVNSSLDAVSPGVSSQPFDAQKHVRFIIDNRQTLARVLAEQLQALISTFNQKVKKARVDQPRNKAVRPV